LPAYGYRGVETPALDALFAEGTVFENTHAHAPITLPSHASILTGLYPPEHGLRNNGSFYAKPELYTLGEAFKESGFRTGAFVSAFVLDSRFGLDQGFDVYDDDLNDGRQQWSKFGVKDRRAESTIPRLVKWLDEDADAPFFAWLHLYDPHYEYAPPEPFRSRYKNQYDAEIAYTDFQVGRLLGTLKQRGRYEDLVVAVTSDHGESLGEHRESTRSLFVYQATQAVPLAIRRPGGRAGRVKELARHVDIFPTLTELAGLSRGRKGTSGRSLVGAMNGTPTGEPVVSYAESYLPKDQFGWAPLYALQDERYKYIEAPQAELYDLQTDPREQKNLLLGDAKNATALKGRLALLRAEMDGKAEVATKKPLDAQTEAQLRSLGYLSGTGTDPEQAGKDPKQMIEIHEAREAGHRLMDAGRYREAIRVLEKLSLADQKNQSLFSDLASCHAELGQWDKAEEYYGRARGLASHRISADMGLAKVYFKGRKDYKAAAREIERAFKKAPDEPTLWGLKGDLHHEMGEYKKAVVAYEKAVTAGDQTPTYWVGYASALNLTGELERAQEAAETALQLDSKSAIAHHNHGVILQRRGLFAAAEGAFREARRLSPALTQSTLALARLYDSQGRGAEADAVLARAAEAAPTDYDVLYERGSLLVKRGEHAEGARYLERAVGVAPSRPGGRTNLGFAYENENRLDDAFAQYGALTEIFAKGSAGHCDALLRLARVRARQQQTDQASSYRQEHAKSCGG